MSLPSAKLSESVLLIIYMLSDVILLDTKYHPTIESPSKYLATVPLTTGQVSSVKIIPSAETAAFVTAAAPFTNIYVISSIILTSPRRTPINPVSSSSTICSRIKEYA